MDRWKLWSVLLLTIPFYIDSEEIKQLHKTVGSKPDVTPICSNETFISSVVCKIRNETNGGEVCHLVYDHVKGFEHKCDSRFKLMTQNQTVFLHLTNLTPEDSGNYTCQCFHLEGVLTLYLNITVEEDEDASNSTQTQTLILSVLIGAAIVVMIAGVILGLFYRQIRHSKQPQPQSSPPNMDPGDIEPYSTFIRRESGLYSTVRVNCSNTNTNNSKMFTREDTHAGKSL
ncbi:uncharacterized protein LOC104938623 isoform X1 [Larimichthys crocea]|uniref:uncharacterized protein LOC104938623 isoform X1 n=1 Tax=Larimichthys crocea TaxID=215358 RepID=UPI000F5DBA49|nr:uncharacterized protein LOC104938623 isoform X1 [Larimichthys crocea]XP_027131898.1 uncharacterized protein LOC104938623 isoform X1 [Larimichthys crocea]